MEANATFLDGKLNPTLSKLLGDKLYDKRKSGALQIEQIVRDAIKENNNLRITLLVECLSRDFVYSMVPNSRNGGLIALAATAIALSSHVSAHLHEIVPPILTCLSDHDSRVRYYGTLHLTTSLRSNVQCGYFSCHAVGKVARDSILAWFNEIFDCLTKLSVDPEISVKNGAELLDRLIKDIVCEKSSYYHPGMKLNKVEGSHPLSVPGSRPFPGEGPLTFNLPRFIPLLMERIHVINDPGRLFLVQWIFVLNSVPDLELVAFLPEFLDGLFVFLADSNLDVRTATLNVFTRVTQEFLKEIHHVVQVQSSHGFFPVKEFSPDDSDSKFPNIPYVPGQAVQLDFGRMTTILSKYLSNTDEETRATALRWINTFIKLAKSTMLPFTPLLLETILPTLSHSVASIKTLAVDANTNLFTIVLESSDAFVDVVTAVKTLMTLCEDIHEDTRIGALEWLLMLHKKFKVQIMNSGIPLFQGLLKGLSDYSDEVVRRDLQLLAQMCHSSDDEYFHKFMVNLLQLFRSDRRLVETRGSLIIRQLCVSLDPERTFRSFGDILEQESDLEFATAMVQTLHLILTTAPELGKMRRRLKNIENRDGFSLFSSLYSSWCHNPIACFSLCLLAQAYEHASNLLTIFGELEITVAFLIQTDKLVQLLESPVFTSLRLQLLEPDRYPHLNKCMYGILMLLPQSSAFATLRNRLSCLGGLTSSLPTNPPVPSSIPPVSPNNLLNRKKTVNESSHLSPSKWADFLSHFKMIQLRHERARRALHERQYEDTMRPRAVSDPQMGSDTMLA